MAPLRVALSAFALLAGAAASSTAASPLPWRKQRLTALEPVHPRRRRRSSTEAAGITSTADRDAREVQSEEHLVLPCAAPPAHNAPPIEEIPQMYPTPSLR